MQQNTDTLKQANNQAVNKPTEAYKLFSGKLTKWRNNFSISEYTNNNNSTLTDNKSKLTVATLFSGGLTDTISALKCDFRPLWGADPHSDLRDMWTFLTHTKCYKNVFSNDVIKSISPNYLKCNPPSDDYIRGGNGSGGDGETGWMFTKLPMIILKLQPESFLITISDNVYNIHNGLELSTVKKNLKCDYIISESTLPVWQYGDPSARKWLHIVGINRKLGQSAYNFRFPKPKYDNSYWPKARMIAEPDADVPEECWLEGNIQLAHQGGITPERPTLHRISTAKRKPGIPSRVVYSWEGLLNNQTGCFGRGLRPPLKWKPGKPLERVRSTTPIEAVRAASLPDDYHTMCEAFAGTCDKSQFIRQCANMGTPVRTGVAIDHAILLCLQTARETESKPMKRWASLVHKYEVIRSTLFDTGANGSLNHRDVEPYLIDACCSKNKIEVAKEGESLHGYSDGKLMCSVLNTVGNPNCEWKTELKHNTTTADGLTLELFSFDEFYQSGWGLHCRPFDVGSGSSEMYRPARNNQPAINIPLRYDWSGGGGFYIDYMLGKEVKSEHKHWLAARHIDATADNSQENYEAIQYFNIRQTRAKAGRTELSPDVVHTILGQHRLDCELAGVKFGLKKGRDKMRNIELHRIFGHLGHSPNCKICKMTKGASRRIKVTVDPHRETRPGHTWHMDTITFSHRSSQGNKYLTALRDEASGVVVVLKHYLRDDVRDLIDRWITVLRNDQAFHNCGYKIVSVIHLDNAGEWQLDCAAWVEIVERQGFTPIYSCPDRKESAANAERTMGILEIVIKSMLMDSNLPPQWWEYAADMAEFLLNRFPVSSDLVSVPIDGDRARPLEILTKGFYSRRQIDRELSYFVPLGTPCLVQTTEKGSSLQPKTRWGIAVGCYREQPIFWCPHNKTSFRSKSFAAFTLREGLNFMTFLGMKQMEPSQASLSIQDDLTQRIDVVLQEVQTCAEVEHADDVVKVKAIGDTAMVPVVKVSKSDADKGGSVQVITPEGLPVHITTDPCDKFEHDDDYKLTSHLNTGRREKRKSERLKGTPLSKPTQLLKTYVDCIPSHKLQESFDEIDARKVSTKAELTRGGDTFVKICKRMKLDFGQHNIYRKWLITERHALASDLPESIMRRNQTVKTDIVFPYPSGKRWQNAKAKGSRRRLRSMHVDISLDGEAILAAEQWVQQELKSQDTKLRSGGKYAFFIHLGSESINRQAKAMAVRNKKKRTKAVSKGKIQAPKNTADALWRDDSVDWVKSMGNEFYGLVEMGVFELGLTKAQLLERGVDITRKPPVPIGEYYECKFDENGELAKRKTRHAIQGHPGNMTKGIHYFETFSATPRESTSRILQALCVHLNLTRCSFDITKAYCWADLPENERIALTYPSAFKEVHPITGEDLYLLQMKNLYGSPPAGRHFSKQRNKTLLEKFSQDNWSIYRTKMDPCLFLIKRTYKDSAGKSTVARGWMLAHVDDCDLVCEGQQITDDIMIVCKSIWKCEVISSDFMLGIRRRLTHDSEGVVQQCDLDMIPFIEGMAETFREHLPKPHGGKFSTPLEPDFNITKKDEVSDLEVKEVLEAGQQVGCGMALWAARHCFPECRVGISILCRVMARPSWKAFQGLMRMIAWMYQERSRGIRYSKDGNSIPAWLVDSSAKADPYDHKCQYGACGMWMGGPIMDISKKLTHISLATQTAEYMAMAFAHQAMVWMRQLFQEMDLDHLIEHSTLMFGDNKPANILSKEDVVTSGNQYIYLPYHYNKEVQELGLSIVHYVCTKDNISDLLTKAVKVAEFKALADALTGHNVELLNRLISAAWETITSNP